jgi:hypothetical protein
MPSSLDLLFRFFEYNNENEKDNWVVSGGTLEGTKRYYRVMYESDTKFECELVFENADSDMKAKIHSFVNAVLKRINLGVSDTFRKMFDDLTVQDPWINKHYTPASVMVSL